MTRQHIVFLTGAGISVESGLSTFRGKDGLWTKEEFQYFASTDCLYSETEKCLDFYNMRRQKLSEVEPNDAHRLIAELEKEHEVTVITQNVDDLHERAGSTSVLHLHGELMKVRSMTHPERVYDLTGGDLETSLATRDPYGDPVRPHIVFFQEDVPNFSPAVDLVAEADVFVVIGTSLVVYPAAALINYVRRGVPIYYIDPRPAAVPQGVHVIAEKATVGVPILTKLLLQSCE